MIVALNTINPATHYRWCVCVCFFGGWGGVLVRVGMSAGFENLPIHIFEVRNTIRFHTLCSYLFTYSYIQLKHHFPKNTRSNINLPCLIYRIRLLQILWNYRRICLSDKEAWNVLKRKFKQWWTTIKSIFTKQSPFSSNHRT